MVSAVALVACQPGAVADNLATEPTSSGESVSSMVPMGTGDQGPPPDTSAPSAPPSGADPADGPAPSETAETAPASGADAPIAITVVHECVSAGGEQTVTVTSTPGFQVTVNPRYADGQMGNIHGGLAFAQIIGEDGTFTHTWTISPEAPEGEVTVLAGAQSTSEQSEPVTTSVEFLVADRC